MIECILQVGGKFSALCMNSETRYLRGIRLDFRGQACELKYTMNGNVNIRDSNPDKRIIEVWQKELYVVIPLALTFNLLLPSA